jgi:purine-binding chemotaxis protein CheW
VSRHVLFSRAATLYAIEAEAVLEITELAWLNPWPGDPETALGMIDYRGLPVPVIDLQRRLGGPASAPRIQDQLLFFQIPGTAEGDSTAALLIDSAEDLRDIEAHIHPLSESDRRGMWLQAGPHVLGLATLEERVAVVLDRTSLSGLGRNEQATERLDFLAAGLSSEERELLVRRAQTLAAQARETIPVERIQVVVFRWGSELFGVEVGRVAELTPCPSVTPVPGGPTYLLGLIYHRGSLLRLVDVRGQLGLSTEESPYRPAEIVVLNGSGILTGIGVDAIEAVADLDASQLSKGRGSVSYQDGWLTLIDPTRLVLQEPLEKSFA